MASLVSVLLVGPGDSRSEALAEEYRASPLPISITQGATASSSSPDVAPTETTSVIKPRWNG